MRTYLGDVSCWMNSRQHFFSLSFSMLTQSPLIMRRHGLFAARTSVKICFLNRTKGSHRDVSKFCIALRSGTGLTSVRHSWIRNRHKSP